MMTAKESRSKRAATMKPSTGVLVVTVVTANDDACPLLLPSDSSSMEIVAIDKLSIIDSDLILGPIPHAHTPRT
jgi:hypothetical protein